MKRIALAGLLVMGCAPTVSDRPPPPQRPKPPRIMVPPTIPAPPGDEAAEVQPVTPCRIEAAADLVGKPFTPALRREAQMKVGAKSVRVIGPLNNAITMDYRPDRLNIEVGPDNKVMRFRCG